MAAKKYQNQDLISRCYFLPLILFFIFLSSCKNDDKAKKVDVQGTNKDTLRTIISDFSKGSYFLTVKIKNDRKVGFLEIIIQNNELANIVRGRMNGSEYEKSVLEAIKNNTPLDVSDNEYHLLCVDSVVAIDTSIINASAKGLGYFINRFFRRNSRGTMFSCFSDFDIEKQVLFVLTSNFKILVYRDDESGCVLLPRGISVKLDSSVSDSSKNR